MTRRPIVLGVLLAAGLLALVASSQPWWIAVATEAATSGSVTFSGSDATGGLSQALAVVVLAGVLLSLVLAARGRRVLAVLLGLAGLAVAVVGALRAPPSAAAIRTRFRQISLVEQYALEGTVWPGIYALAGAGIVLGAVLLFVVAPRWSQRGQRFERRPPTAALSTATSLTPAGEVAADDPAQVWSALDAGIDPTVPADDDTTRDRHPDVRSGVTTDTMVGEQVEEQNHEQDRNQVEEHDSGGSRNADREIGSGGGSAPSSRRRNEEQ